MSRRPRPPAPPQAPTSNKRNPSAPLGAPRTPLVGGILRIKLAEAEPKEENAEEIMRDILSGHVVPSDRILNLELGVKWEVGEGGLGGGLSVGESMDASGLILVSVRPEAPCA